MADSGHTRATIRRRAMYDSRRGGRVFPAAFLVIAATAVFLLIFAMRSEAVLGPPGPYSEANGDIIEICADAACAVHTTEFNPGDTIYVRVTTDRVSAVSGNRNRMRLRLYEDTNIRVSNWNQVSATPPYVYTSQIVIPNGQVEYMKIWGRVRKGNSGPRVQFEQQISLVGVNQYMKLYSDASRSDESYTFAPGSTVYIRAWGTGSAYSPSRTGSGQQRLRTFSNATRASWPAPIVTQNGNWYDFQLTIPASGLIDGDWYWLQTLLRPASGGDIERESRMLQIDDSAPIAAITAPFNGAWVSGSLPVEGTADDTYSFNDYLVEYGAGAAPSSWSQIGSAGTTPVVAGLLQTWDTTAVSDGLYTLRLTVTDRAYNSSTDSVQVNVDNNAPTISAVQASGISSNSANITWTTDEIADSQVEYGTSPGVYTWSTPLDPTLVTSHSQVLAGLQQSTYYYYRVRSADQAGNVSYSTEDLFKTANVTTLQLYPGSGKDTYIGSIEDTWNHGAEASMRTGDQAASGLGTVRSTLAFDLSGIPAGSTINSATLSLYQASQEDTSTPTFDVHYLTRDWTEGTGNGSATGDGATWLSYDGIGLWTTSGGDYNAAASSSAVAPNSTGAWVDWDMGSLTQDWVDGIVTNYGMLLKQDFENPAGDDAKYFLTSNYVNDRSLRPKLTIEWVGDDVSSPQIGEVRAENVSTASADIKWSTDEGATTQIDYGTTSSYGSSSTLDSNIVNQHTVSLAGLTQETVYHYRVRSMDPSGNETVSGDYVFQTARQIVIQPGPVDGYDDFFQSNQPSLNSGAAPWLLAGDFQAAFWGSVRSTLRFDLSAIPVGSAINSATLSLYQAGQADTSTPTLDVHYLTRDWAEGTGTWSATGDGATWSTYDGVNNWTSPGGDYFPTTSASAVAPNSSASWVNWDLTSLTQSWINESITNYGILIKQDVEDPTGRDLKLYASSDYVADPSLRPRLVIEYIPAPGTITMTIDETWNRDNTPGASSVAFGNVSAGSTYIVGDTLAPPYAVKLTIKANSLWGLKVAASDDLQSSPPGNNIGISNLNWKRDSQTSASYQPMVKSPAETVIDSNQEASNGVTYLFDYRLAVPALAVSGNYSTSVVYTAYPE